MPEYDANKLIFLDESGVNINMTRHYGRAVGKSRAVDSTPLNTPVTTTILSSVKLNGETAHITYSGGTTGAVFTDYLKNVLIPSLHAGDTVVMDNMRSHHVKQVREILNDARINLLYLPPYSPDLNPIEEMWSKLKAVLRRIKVRISADLPAAIAYAFNAIRPSDCSGWFRLSGYLL